MNKSLDNCLSGSTPGVSVSGLRSTAIVCLSSDTRVRIMDKEYLVLDLIIKIEELEGRLKALHEFVHGE